MKVYKVYDDSYGQHGTNIVFDSMTRKEYYEKVNDMSKGYFLTDDYLIALEYTQD